MTAQTRIERDTMGEMMVPADALYGASTQRAVENFPISGRPVSAEVVHAFGRLKAACAKVNQDLGKLDADKATLIIEAAGEVAEGQLDRHFPVDIFQTGSGTSTNMNANEVIANRCAQAAGNPIGAKDPIHPNDHVNMGQSSNDTFPTAMQIAGAVAITGKLVPSLQRLAKSLKDKAEQWDDITKIGRTHLMDATPIRLGQEFSGYAAQAEYAVTRAKRAAQRLAENLPIGGTAVGTGINTHVEFGTRIAAELSRTTGIEFTEAPNHFEAQATRDCVVEASGELKTIAVSFSKIANDIRWLGSGPRCGLFELSLPATQPGSSIMPGKVNPVMCESMIQVACQVIGNDAAITYGGFGGVGSLMELNVGMPMMAANLFDSINILANIADAFVDKLLDGLEANEAICTGMVEKSLMMCTSLAPVIGYEKAAQVAKAAFKENKTIREYCTEQKLLDPAKLDELLDPTSMTHPGGK
ncbi:MAG: class II fumarate hydratase [Phycisphaerales bacterium]|nr:class II fumarate hydratase [Phycisphaerales bacterium]